MTKLIIRGGCVLSMDPAIGNRREADVLVEDGLVTEVGTNLRSRGADDLDASDAVVLPGFVDAHRHAGETLARNAPDGITSDYTADDVYAATLAGLLSAVESGVTTVADWSSFAGDDQASAALQAHEDAGLRTVLVMVDPAGARDRWRHRISSTGTPPPLTRLAAGPPAPSDWAFARELGLRVHVHAGADIATSPAPGMFGPDVTLTHCTGFGAAEFDAVAGSGAAVVLTPTSDMAAGAPPVQIQELIDRAIRPGVGTGAMTMAAGDVFAQLRAIIALQHATYFERKLAGKAGLPRLLSTRDVIRYGTIDGARALGMAGDAGSIGAITPGRAADIVVLRTDRPNIVPVNDPIGAVVWGMDTSNIDTVLVAGRALVRDGALTADLAHVRSLVRDAQQRVRSRTQRPAIAGEPA